MLYKFSYKKYVQILTRLYLYASRFLVGFYKIILCSIFQASAFLSGNLWQEWVIVV